MKANSQKVAESFFADLDRDIGETPGEKDARIARRLREHQAQQQAKLEKLRGLAGKSVEVPLALVDTSQNIRAHIDTDSEGFRTLIEDIKQREGALQQPVVTLLDDEDGLRLVCLAGHRRILAAQRAGHRVITVAVRRVETEADRISIALGENLLREDLHALDIASALLRLRALGETHDQLAARFGKNKKTIGHFIKMADEWPDKARQLIREHPKSFNTSFLLRLAKRKLDNERVVAALNDKLSGGRPPPSLPRPAHRRAQLDAYFETQKVSERDRDVIVKALTTLNWL